MPGGPLSWRCSSQSRWDSPELTSSRSCPPAPSQTSWQGRCPRGRESSPELNLATVRQSAVRGSSPISSSGSTRSCSSNTLGTSCARARQATAPCSGALGGRPPTSKRSGRTVPPFATGTVGRPRRAERASIAQSASLDTTSDLHRSLAIYGRGLSTSSASRSLKGPPSTAPAGGQAPCTAKLDSTVTLTFE